MLVPRGEIRRGNLTGAVITPGVLLSSQNHNLLFLTNRFLALAIIDSHNHKEKRKHAIALLSRRGGKP